MFGYVRPCLESLDEAQKKRYRAWYCGLCQSLGDRHGFRGRMTLTYDMTFLAIFLSALYEPAEAHGQMRCLPHPKEAHDFVRTSMTDYAADMTIALAYFKALDDWQDDGKKSAKWMADRFAEHLPRIEADWPRQCQAIRRCLERLSQLEAENCPNPDEPAGAFGELMGELFYVREDMWTDTLRQMGNALGRFVYLLDAELDYDKDKKQGKYNPFLAKGEEKNLQVWEDYLVLTMGRCTESFEKLPLVQDKPLLDNVLYSGVWVSYHRGKKKEEEGHD